MPRRSRWLALALSIVGGFAVLPSAAQSPVTPIKIGLLEDMSSVFSDLSGPGSIFAARMAVEDFGGKVLGRPVQVVSADHQNKTDIGSGIARRWLDEEGVGMILGLGNSGVALAVQYLAQQKDRVSIVVTAGSPDFTGKACGPTSIHWMHDTPALTKSVARVVIGEGGDTWFFVTVDFAGGHVAEASMAKAVKDGGGKVLGTVRHPLNSADFASFLLQAQSSKAKVVSFANFGNDFVNSVKQAAEFGIAAAGQRIAPAVVYFTDVHALGLTNAQGLFVATPFYWDMNDETRKWSARFQAERKVMPDHAHAGVYTAVTHYLKAMEAAGTDDARKVVGKMRELPIHDMISSNAWLREDGRVIRDMLIYQVKRPDESTRPFDYFRYVSTVPGAEAFHKLSESECPLVKRQ